MKRIAIVGTGLIGGSIGLALRRAGHEVVGVERDPQRAALALEVGAVSELLSIEDAARRADLVMVAVPVSSVADLVVAALDAGALAVSDVGSVKAEIVKTVTAARPSTAMRFVGGHPMAGSELDGLDGANADLFVGSTWVLTPTAITDADAFTTVRSTVVELGADAVAVPPARHDDLVAVVSHVPQLAASVLMDLAAETGEEHATLLRLAAGGFRDMTRIAGGHTAIWPDICETNREAIVATLDRYIAALGGVRSLVEGSDRAGLLAVLERARTARRSLPGGRPVDEALVELRLPVPDRSGVIGEVTTLAGQLDVNIADIEITHSVEGRAGLMSLVVPEAGAVAFEAGLRVLGYHVARSSLS